MMCRCVLNLIFTHLFGLRYPSFRTVAVGAKCSLQTQATKLVNSAGRSFHKLGTIQKYQKLERCAGVCCAHGCNCFAWNRLGAHLLAGVFMSGVLVAWVMLVT